MLISGRIGQYIQISRAPYHGQKSAVKDFKVWLYAAKIKVTELRISTIIYIAPH